MILIFFLFFCKLSNHLSINWLIDWDAKPGFFDDRQNCEISSAHGSIVRPHPYRYPQVRLGPVAAAAHRAALARHTWASHIQARSHHVRLPARSSSTVGLSDRLLSTGLRCGVTALWRQHLRSASRRLLVVPYRVTVSARTAAGLLPSPGNLRDPDVTTDNFKRLLKMFLFSAYQCN